MCKHHSSMCIIVCTMYTQVPKLKCMYVATYTKMIYMGVRKSLWLVRPNITLCTIYLNTWAADNIATLHMVPLFYPLYCDLIGLLRSYKNHTRTLLITLTVCTMQYLVGFAWVANNFTSLNISIDMLL